MGEKFDYPRGYFKSSRLPGNKKRTAHLILNTGFGLTRTAAGGESVTQHSLSRQSSFGPYVTAHHLGIIFD